MDRCTVADLRKMTFNKHVRPCKFHTGRSETVVNSWSHLSVVFVHWLITSGNLTGTAVPIPNHAGLGKYFINNRPQHRVKEMGGYWQNVGEFHVDTKYTADAHIKNILSTLSHLGISRPKFRISFTADKAGAP